MLNNLPPGVSDRDIPGNRPEDVLYEKLFEELPVYIQNEIENESENGKKLDAHLQELIGKIFTEDDLIREMNIYSTYLEQKNNKEEIEQCVVQDVGNCCKTIIQSAWKLYCNEAGFCAGAVDYWEQVSKYVQYKYIYRIVRDKYPWLRKNDLEFAIALQEEDKLEAVKWLREKAKGHSLTPLKDAKEILDAYL